MVYTINFSLLANILISQLHQLAFSSHLVAKVTPSQLVEINNTKQCPVFLPDAEHVANLPLHP